VLARLQLTPTDELDDEQARAARVTALLRVVPERACGAVLFHLLAASAGPEAVSSGSVGRQVTASRTSTELLSIKLPLRRPAARPSFNAIVSECTLRSWKAVQAAP